MGSADLSTFPSNVILLDDKSHVLKPPGMLGLRHGLFYRMIPLAILNQYGPSQMNLKKEDILFKEGRWALNYFQILSGSIKLITTSVGGQEFIQGIFKEEDSFGEPPLFMSLLNFLKQDSERHSTDKNWMIGSNEVYFVPFARQQIGDMSGLRVETVIRTVKRMEANGKLKLLGRKIAF